MLPHYTSFFAAVQRGADEPPELSSSELSDIKDAVESSMAQHIDYTFWDNADLEFPPPSPDLDTEHQSKKAKF